MVSLLSLYVFAGVLLVLAGLVGWLRRLGPHSALADGCAALTGTLLLLLAAVVLFAVAGAPTASAVWADAGSVVLVASPIGGVLALGGRGRGSILGALVASGIALAGVTIWLTLNLRGPRGGWTPIDLALTLLAAAVAMASAACLGWWSRRRTAAEAPLAAGR